MRLSSVCASVALLLCAACSAAPSTPSDPSPAATTAVVQEESVLSAQDVVTALGEEFDLPNPRENTGFCEPSGCVQMVTTDPVTIAQFPTPAKAKAYAKGIGGPTVAVGSIVVSCAGRRGGDLWPAKKRKRLVAEVRRIVAGK